MCGSMCTLARTVVSFLPLHKVQLFHPKLRWPREPITLQLKKTRAKQNEMLANSENIIDLIASALQTLTTRQKNTPQAAQMTSKL